MFTNCLTQWPRSSRKIIPKFTFVILVLLPVWDAIAQNCVVDFPGSISQTYSGSCSSGSDNLSLGENVALGDGDTFIFDSPTIININGNLQIFTEGSGTIIIPAGITVLIDGNISIVPVNGGCDSGNPCTLTILVDGDLIADGNFSSSVNGLEWSGTGTIDVDGNFENGSNGCMRCSPTTSCPGFPSSGGNCTDSGSGCPAGDFCTTGNYGNPNPIPAGGDTIDPVISNCPSDIVTTAESSSCSKVISWTPPTASDNVSVSTFTSNFNPGDTFPVGETSVVYVATDPSGNSSTCSFTISINDTTEPVFTSCPEDIVTNICSGPVFWTVPVASDNCSVTLLSSNYNPGDSFPIGTTEVIYTASDEAGNENECSFFVTVNGDTTPPEFTSCNADIYVEITDGNCNTQVFWDSPTAVDDCSVNLISNLNSGDIFPIGTTTVIYEAKDPSENSSFCSFNVNVSYKTQPEFINCPEDIIVSLSENLCEIQVNWNELMVAESCSPTTITSTHTSGQSFQIGVTPVTYTATDSNGNLGTCSFNVIVEDKFKPSFEFCPTSVNVFEFNIDTQNAEVSWEPPLVVDNCSEVEISSVYSPGDRFSRGSTDVIYTARDQYGNESTCSFTVNVIGNSYPEISSQRYRAFSGESTEFCLEISDPEDDRVFINRLISVEGESTVEISDETCFTLQSTNEFEGQERVLFEICDDGEPMGCIEAEVIIDLEYNLNLTVYKAITPNGDSQNDLWVIENIDNYPDNQVLIFDRWGGLVFSATGYNNENIVWDGKSNQGGNSILPAGTYFYKIVPSRDSKVMQGFIELVY